MPTIDYSNVKVGDFHFAEVILDASKKPVCMIRGHFYTKHKTDATGVWQKAILPQLPDEKDMIR